MNTDYQLKKGDTSPPLRTQFTVNGGVQDLSSADSVRFEMHRYAGEETVSGTAQILNAGDGSVAYHWESGDTDVPGLYFAEWIVKYPDGSEQSFPNDEFDLVYIKDDL